MGLCDTEGRVAIEKELTSPRCRCCSDGVGTGKMNVNPEGLATGRAIIQISTETKCAHVAFVLGRGANERWLTSLGTTALFCTKAPTFVPHPHSHQTCRPTP